MSRLRSLACFSPVLTLAALLLAPPGRAAADIAYAITGAGMQPSTLYTLDTTTGVASPIAAITISSTPVMVSSIAFNPTNGQLYGEAQDPGSLKGELITINLATGVATPVGTFGLSPGSSTPASIAFDGSGNLYGYFKSPTPESLYSIDTGTGAATKIGASGYSSGTSGDGMAIHPSTGSLYFAGTGASGTLDTLSTSTGAFTTGATISGAPFSGGQIKALAFSSSGTLYGINLNTSGTLKQTDVFTIDPTSGMISNAEPTSVNGLISLAFAPASVPEPSSFALVGLVSALGWCVHRKARARPFSLPRA